MKFEYILTTFSVPNKEHVIEELTKLGEEGWEAVAISSTGHVLMKRPKSN